MFDRRDFLKLSMAYVLAVSSSVSVGSAKTKGTYKGKIITEWLGSVNMRLTEPIEYIDTEGLRWPVPSGTVVNGASIPKFLWSLVGSPLHGNYRAASVIHDHFCDVRTRSSDAVHKMFYSAMITSGVANSRAWLMYEAVNKFGPYWSDPGLEPKCQIIGEDYDFINCAQNNETPEKIMPNPSRTEVIEFLQNLDGNAHQSDITKIIKGL